MNKNTYNNIMKNVSKVVKKRLNEEYDEFDELDSEDDMYSDDYDEFDDEAEPFLSDEDEILYHDGEQAALDAGYGPYDDEDCYDWSDDDTLTESLDDIYGDDDTFMFDEDKENEFYDSEGNWDPIEDDEEEFDLDTPEGHICDVVGGMQYVDFTRTSPVHLIDADVDIEQIDSDDYSVTLTDTDGDTYELSDFTENDLQILSDAIDDYVTEVGDDY